MSEASETCSTCGTDDMLTCPEEFDDSPFLPDVPVTVDTLARTVAPRMEHVDPMQRFFVCVQRTVLPMRDDSKWGKGPNFCFYPPRALLGEDRARHRTSGGDAPEEWPNFNWDKAAVSIFPSPMYSQSHVYMGTVYEHAHPWIPRPLIWMPDGMNGMQPTPCANPMGVDAISHWRMVFKHFFTYAKCGPSGGFWGGKHISYHIVGHNLVKRSEGLNNMILRMEIELQRMLRTVLVGFEPDSGDDPLTFLPRRAYETEPDNTKRARSAEAAWHQLQYTAKALSHGVFTTFPSKDAADRFSMQVCPFCYAEPIAFSMRMFDWPEPWVVFVTTVCGDTFNNGSQRMCTLCKMEYLDMLDKDHHQTMMGIAMLANKALRTAQDIALYKQYAAHKHGASVVYTRSEIRRMTAVPAYIQRVPMEIWQHIGAMAKKDLEVDDRLLRSGKVYAKAGMRGVVTCFNNQPHTDMWGHHRRMHKWLEVVRSVVGHAPCGHYKSNDSTFNF